ncbi:hypothetical protein A3H10_04470 [Candidatus Uhrbacteria bacterium RIFCSPLOWO2_12_FULL_46_10]|uniref:Uncharacterized protein n=1 Tax=Candidatus Uhrbacteria bacterium RIFCSPLOWO2_01_FULL_47_25 TaxID=1802402 RepID=A0A1F7UT42_9BACT|nr:MAG: hypothetical protein UX68_C0015G0013 [Parcubacteria group bacterium GW2011_GWA2_46_9]OGL59887.1 MAG: hypothetical protein A2752_04060 [Candidatus Uhrbacteria bacterium RIFCSPHIGHO2_01_FULL_46_23]OGL69438.1 MAG: hypothetical protein A3D60_03130 [Candidatus Uhrbacteria bacterium RIFCSPHIGHO2_02_FULL_47_29]OGL75350.1 MAG: hypothetical protein A3E96_02450 [Candidatus Uhrbacteria bacterium RIFCSPHIGHO2_12_FULL_46_13]OGL80894.1 MAG: hypothetical protein A2936_05695 [Candidatus Uhrbacteria bac
MTEQLSTNPVLSESWFKWASRWVRYRPILQKIALVSVIVIEAVLIIYSSYVWIDYFVISRNREKFMYQELSRPLDLHKINQTLSPKPITILYPLTLPAGGSGGLYDVLAKLANSNQNWLALVSYQFAVNGEKGPASEILLLNDDEKYIIGAGLAPSPSASVEMIINSVNWQRLRERAKFNERKPRFSISDVKFAPVIQKGAPASPIGRVSFTVINESSYNFWSVGFKIILLKGDRPVAARFMTLEQVRSVEQRPASLNIYNIASSAVDHVLVVPEVNITDPGVYMSVPGESIGF